MIALIVGDPKTGKTVSAGTFPKPALILDFDDGALSIEKTTGPDGKLVCGDWDGFSIVKFLVEEPIPLSFVTADVKRGGPPPVYAASMSKMLVRVNAVFDELAKDGCVPSELVEGAEAGGRIGPFKTVIIDPLTQMFRIWKGAVMHDNRIPGMRIQDYLTLEHVLFNVFVPNLKLLHSKVEHVILTVHEDIDKDEATGVLVEFPVGPSKAMGKQLSESFDEVWRMGATAGVPHWDTKAGGRFSSAGSRNHLPKVICPATYEELKKHL